MLRYRFPTPDLTIDAHLEIVPIDVTAYGQIDVIFVAGHVRNPASWIPIIRLEVNNIKPFQGLGSVVVGQIMDAIISLQRNILENYPQWAVDLFLRGDAPRFEGPRLIVRLLSNHNSF